MIAFRLILLRIKFTTCATCHAFYLKRYQTSCSFCVYIVSTHHATILIASLILQIPASPSISTQRRQILLLHPILPSLPLSSSKFPTSPSISTQRRQILQIPLHTLPILYPIRLKSPYNPPGSPTLPTPPSILSQFSTPFGSNPPIIPLALPTPQHLATSHSLLTANCSLLIAHCSLPIAHCSLLIAHCSLLIAHCSLLIANC